MRILCCLDGVNIAEMHAAITASQQSETSTIGLLYVTDSGPQREMERQRERFLRPHALGGPRREEMREAEQHTAQDILDEGKRFFPNAETAQLAGQPEREIALYAAQWRADLIVICMHTPLHAGPPIGPRSVGHVARFVLDHAPCPVLLLRPVMGENFSLPR